MYMRFDLSKVAWMCLHVRPLSPQDVLTAALDIAIERSDAVSKMDRNRLLHKLLEEQGVDLAAVALNRYFASCQNPMHIRRWMWTERACTGQLCFFSTCLRKG